MHDVISYPDLNLFKVVGGPGSRLCTVTEKRLTFYVFVLCLNSCFSRK